MLKCHTKHIIVLDLDHLKQGKETVNGGYPEEKYDVSKLLVPEKLLLCKT